MTDYVLELQRKLSGEIDRTQSQLASASSSTVKKSIQRRLKTLRDQDAELAAYQAKLQTLASDNARGDIIKNLVEDIENLYAYWFLDELGAAWSDALEAQAGDWQMSSKMD